MSEHDPTVPRTFGQFISTLEDGRLDASLSEALRDLVADLHDAALTAGGKAGGKISISIAFNMEGGMVEAACDFSVKAPKLKRGRSIFWATPENNLTRRNPAQQDLPFRDVSVPSARGLA